MRWFVRPSHLAGVAVVVGGFGALPTAANAYTVTPLASCPPVIKPTVGSLTVPTFVHANFNRQLGSLSGSTSFVVRATPTDDPGSTAVVVRVIDALTGKHQLGGTFAVPRASGCGRVTVPLQDLSLVSDYLRVRRIYAVRVVVEGERLRGLDAYFGGATGFFLTY